MASSKKYNARSISFPSRPHPSTTRLEEHLNKLNTWHTSDSDSLSNGVSMLEELYVLVDDLLNMGSTQQVLSRSHHNIDALLESSVKLLDVCGVTRDLLSQTNERVREVQSVIRRRRGNKGDPSLEACVSSYVSFRKKVMKKDVKKLVSTLRQVDKSSPQDQDTNSCDNNDHFYAVIRVLRRVCETSVVVFQALLSFMGVSESKSKSNPRWSLVAKFVHKGVVACEDQQVNEFEKVDSELIGNINNVETFDMGEAQRSLEALEKRVDGLENGLEIVFRRLIRTRASLLNIISQ